MRLTPGTLLTACVWLLLSARAPAGTQAPTTTIQGTVEAVSLIPDPVQSPYEDALFVVKLRPHPEGSAGLLLALPAFSQRKLLPFASLQPGDRVRAAAQLFVDMPAGFREMQILDDFQDLTMELYGAWDAERIADFSDAPDSAPAAAAPRTAGQLTPVQLSASERQARAARIQHEIRRLESLLAPHGDYESWYDSLAPLRDSLRTRMEDSGADHLRQDHFALERPAFSLGFTLRDDDPRYGAVLHSFEQMAAEFALAGTSLLVVPVPFRDLVCVRAFVDAPPPDGVFAPYWNKFHHDLLRRDIETVDVLPALQESLESHPHLFHYHTHDGHPGTDGAVLIAQRIAESLSGFSFQRPRRVYAIQERVWGAPGGPLYFDGPASRRVLQVTEPDGSPAQIYDADAEVFLFGDSMLTAPPGVPDGHISAHLVHQLGLPLLFNKQAGNAAAFTSHLAREPDLAYFSHRKVAIFLFAFTYVAHESTHWRSFPFLSARMDPSERKDDGAR